MFPSECLTIFLEFKIRVKVTLQSHYHTLVTLDDMVTVIVTWSRVEDSRTMILYNVYNIY